MYMNMNEGNKICDWEKLLKTAVRWRTEDWWEFRDENKRSGKSERAGLYLRDDDTPIKIYEMALAADASIRRISPARFELDLMWHFEQTSWKCFGTYTTGSGVMPWNVFRYISSSDVCDITVCDEGIYSDGERWWFKERVNGEPVKYGRRLHRFFCQI